MSNSAIADNNKMSNLGRNKVEMYSTALCPYCTRARLLFEKKGVDVTEFRIDKDASLRNEMERRSRRSSVPQIFIGDRHIGGFDELAQLEFGEELDSILGIE